MKSSDAVTLSDHSTKHLNNCSEQITFRLERFDPSGPLCAKVFNRGEVDGVTNFLSKEEAELREYLESQGEKGSAIGETLDTAELSALVVSENCGTRALLLFLPPIFEASLQEMVSQTPELFNYTDLDLLTNKTYHGFRGLQIGGKALALWVNSFELSDADSTCNGRGAERFMTVVMVAGDLVVVGGYRVDDDFIGCAQGASMSAGSYFAQEVYSDEELALGLLMQQRFGNTPWRTGLWETHCWSQDYSFMSPPVAQKKSCP